MNDPTIGLGLAEMAAIDDCQTALAALIMRTPILQCSARRTSVSMILLAATQLRLLLDDREMAQLVISIVNRELARPRFTEEEKAEQRETFGRGKG